MTKSVAELKTWARQSDGMLVAANKWIATLEQYLSEHREWAMRSEAALAKLKSCLKEPDL
jgi:hypothetical protein